MLVKTSETGCSLVALFFSDFPSLKTRTTAHQCIEIFIVKAAVVSLVVSFTLATIIGAMDVLLSAGQCPVCISHSLGTQGNLHLASGICLELFLLSYFGDLIAV